MHNIGPFNSFTIVVTSLKMDSSIWKDKRTQID